MSVPEVVWVREELNQLLVVRSVELSQHSLCLGNMHTYLQKVLEAERYVNSPGNTLAKAHWTSSSSFAISLPVPVQALIFFTEGLQFRWRCAQTSSDRFFLAVSHYSRSWSSSMVSLNNANSASVSLAHAPGRGDIFLKTPGFSALHVRHTYLHYRYLLPRRAKVTQ